MDGISARVSSQVTGGEGQNRIEHETQSEKFNMLHEQLKFAFLSFFRFFFLTISLDSRLNV